VALIFSILNYRRGTAKIENDETTNIVSVKAELKYMSKQLNDITHKLDKLEESVSDINSRITENATNIRTLFKRYDELKYRIERLEDGREIQ
jgi:hypothetical protein